MKILEEGLKDHPPKHEGLVGKCPACLCQFRLEADDKPVWQSHTEAVIGGWENIWTVHIPCPRCQHDVRINPPRMRRTYQ